MITKINKTSRAWWIAGLFSFLVPPSSFLLSSCDSYIDITPKGSITVDSTAQYYELIVNPMRSYYPSSFIMLSDN